MLLASCAVTPLTNKLSVGEDAIVIGVGEGPDGLTDLYAGSAAGGAVYRLTFTRLQERAPRLSAAGTRLVFLRSSPVETTDPEPEIVVLDLLSNAERGLRLPRESGAPMAVAWLPSDTAIGIRTPAGIWVSPAPPAAMAVRRLAGADSAAVDSVLGVTLGDPVVAVVVACEGGAGVCVRTGTGVIQTLDRTGSGVTRWGTDSVGYWSGSSYAVRSLGGGTIRHPVWRSTPRQFRELTYNAGSAGSAGSAGRRATAQPEPPR
ncbi:MAG: hypothetical protein ACRENB_16490 [Gemmatimonadales bacterium]